MKKLLILLTTLALTLCCGVCLAAGTEYPTPAVGDEIAGFRVTELCTYEPLNADIVYLEHIKTGAKVVWIANDDTNRTFAIGFNTITHDGKGVPHVFEHAALSGSTKYPDAALFFNMYSSTYNTYLNASTTSIATFYPCASLSEEQLLQYADVYLAGVFEPLVLTDVNAMRREAYRYELTDPDSPLTLTGTVYSEMQAAYVASEETYLVNCEIYPGSYVVSESGGIPGEIETMTQQDIIDFHETFYHPSNSYIVLYGDLNIENFLSMIDTNYFSRYDRKEVVIEDSEYVPFEGYSETEVEYAASENAPEKIDLYYAIDLSEMPEDMQKMGATATYIMNSEISPMYFLMLERYPESVFSIEFETLGTHPMITFSLKDAKESDRETFVADVRLGLSLITENGYDPTYLDAVVRNVDISQRLERENTSIGPNLAGNVIIYAAANGGDITTMFDNQIFVLDKLESFMSGTGPIDFVNVVLSAENTKLITARSVPGLLEEREVSAQQALIDRKASMTDEEIAQTIEDTSAFATWTEEIGSVSMIDDVRVVTASELPIEIVDTPASDETIDGMRVISSEIDMQDPVTVTFYFDASHIAIDQLPNLNFVTTEIVGLMDTDIYTYMDMPVFQLSYNMGGEIATISKYGTNEFRPVYAFSFTCMSEDLPAAFAAAESILLHTCVLDRDYLAYNLNSSYVSAKDDAASNASYLAVFYANAAIDSEALYAYYLNDLPYYAYEEQLLAMDDDALSAAIDADLGLFSTLMNKNGFVMTVVGNAENIATAKELGLAFYGKLDDTVYTSVDYATEMEPLPSTIAVEVDVDANYNFMAVNLLNEGVEYDARMSAIDKLVYDDYLIPEMRYKNGVYTPANVVTYKSAKVVAYRDPDTTTTFDTVVPGIVPHLLSTEYSQETVDGYIVAKFSAYALQGGPYARAETAITDILSDEDTPERLREEMAVLRTLTPEDIPSLVEPYTVLAQKGVRVTVGSASAIAESGNDYELVIDWYNR